ncbi:MAG: EAL domain-containing protein [Pseudomonadota bacterium]|nr:EAL domain-containing protein [Pseudomonadota bacterium]
MSTKPPQSPSLRSAAEARLSDARTPASTRPAEELLHELQVHQIELEMQNEELRRAQSALEESRDRYVDLYDFAPVGYLTLTDTGLIVEANLTGAALLGVDRAKLLRRHFTRFVTPEASDHWHHQLMCVLLRGDRQICELAMQRADGSRFYARLDCLCRAVGDPLPRVRIALTDISERRHAEEELRIAAIAFESQEGMMVTDSHSVIVRVNHAFTRLTGYRADEAIGHTPILLRSGRHDKTFYDQMWQTLREVGYWQGEVWNRRKNGKIFAEWLTISAVKTSDGDTTHYVGTFSEITKNQEAQAEIHRLAYYDPLTHLPNRRLLLDRLGQALASSTRSGCHGAVLFLDLDNFKMLNDTRGHAVGDLLLSEIAQRLQTGVREGDTISRLGDTISRLGGDEFVVVLEDMSEVAEEAAHQAKAVGEKVREAVGLPYDLDGREFHCTVSVGITLFFGHDESVETLLKQADLALYQAKGAGRNCLRFFDPAMQSALDERSALEADLRLALKLGQLQLYYQAQVDSARHIIGAEVLLRWTHPQRGLVMPGQFIPLAEESGLILPIGRWVLETVCKQIKAWSGHAASRDLRLAVNVSARQFRQPGFVAEVQQVLAETGIDPTRLKLELTESLVIDNVAETIAKMQALKALGIGFSMDDFGTGYSSLSYLKRLPLEQLKIDRSFVFDLATDPNDAAIVQTIITMGHTLGLNVIAEGVETEAQLERLDQYGCTTYQGFLFSQPVPLAEFEAFLGL